MFDSSVIPLELLKIIMAKHNSGTAISVNGLKKSFGENPVIWDLNLELEWGKFLALFGTNGSGKTTLLKILASQIEADSGQIIISGYDHAKNARAIRRNIGVVGHQHYLYDDLTCAENLQFYGRLYNLNQISERISSVLSRVDLEQYSGRKVRSLSHGMQKRLALGRAILHEPAILLLDEPEGGLDERSLGILHDISSEWTSRNRSIVMTTHNHDLGNRWSDKVGILSNGILRTD